MLMALPLCAGPACGELQRPGRPGDVIPARTSDAVTPVVAPDFGPPPPAAPPSSLDGLIDAALGALGSGDEAAYAALMPTPDEVFAACPGSRSGLAKLGVGEDTLRRELDRPRRVLAERLAECARKLPPGRAARVAAEGGAVGPKDHPGCPGLRPLADITVTLSWSDRRVRVELDNPFVHDGRYGLFGAPSCAEISAP